MQGHLSADSHISHVMGGLATGTQFYAYRPMDGAEMFRSSSVLSCRLTPGVGGFCALVQCLAQPGLGLSNTVLHIRILARRDHRG